ncbi:MAG: flagellar basal body-associated FliL family protein [Limisphaerales bacterium]
MAVKGNETPAPNGTPAPAAPAAGGGMKAMVPLLANLIIMPAVAYGLTALVLVPQLRKGLAPDASAAGEHASAEPAGDKKGHGDAGGKADPSAKPDEKGKITVPMSGKVLVNVAGTSGSRFLVTSMSIVSKNPNLKALLEKNDPQLRDVAASTLSAKTISDLEKAGARNLIRSELISVFNNVLGQGMVTDIYLTDFAIQ